MSFSHLESENLIPTKIHFDRSVRGIIDNKLESANPNDDKLNLSAAIGAQGKLRIDWLS